MVYAEQCPFTRVRCLWGVILKQDVRGLRGAFCLQLLFQAAERPDAHLLVISSRDEYRIRSQRMVPCEAHSSHKSLMSIDLEKRLLLGQVPEDQFSISSSSHHVCEISPAFRHHRHSIRVGVQRSNEWLGEHLLQLGCVQGSLVFSRTLERMKIGVRRVSLHLLQLGISLLLVLLLVSTNRVYFHHFAIY